ncbi:DUF3301 domain-containing protein [Pseudomonas sp. LS44]|uniref:DUF3301 domain-containing protein n=1 Tax=Pseudomonas sp. LS44 TaxID=1357074 RepID=UPI00215A2B44|nr:DUF3301 domain-containing protein [Pseudomonas sp. LS44]UVE17792.1 DUF3301 domain-containing protein [Pseudomonas sp. LS44]
MIGLGDVFLFLLFASALAWLWRGHGIRERALTLAMQHCKRLNIELLDGNVALRRLTVVRDGRNNPRLARIYGFEFTVTGEQRLTGSISMFGQHLGKIEVDAFPFDARAETAADPAPVLEHPPLSNNVVSLNDWRRHHDQ